MSIEAKLKKQAREILAKDNWAKSITGFLCVLSVCCIALLIVDFSTYFMSDDILNKPVHIVIMVAIALVGVVGFILLSPVYTGYVKFIAESKDQKTGDIQSIFYYFAKGRYSKTVLLNLGLFFRYAMLFILCALPLVALLVLTEVKPDYETGFKIGAVWAGLIGGVIFIVISRFYVMVQYLYVSAFDYKKERELIKASRYMVKKNLGKIINLYLSFALYWLLSFFAIPIVFVYPYFKHTAVLSYSYIYEIEKGNLIQKPQQAMQNIDLQFDSFNNPQQADSIPSYADEDSDEKTEPLQSESVTNTQINSYNNSENISDFDNNQQTNQNSFIPDENSDIIM